MPERPAVTRSRLDDRLVLRGGGLLGDQPASLILDVDGYLGECLRVLAPVVRAEKQLSLVREQDANVRLRATAIAEIQGGQRPGGGYSSGHVAFLFSCRRLLRPAGSVCCLCLTAQHNTYPGVSLPFAEWCTPQAKTALATQPAVRVVTGEVPVRFVWFLPATDCPDTHLIPKGVPPHEAERGEAAWLAAGTCRETLPFE